MNLKFVIPMTGIVTFLAGSAIGYLVARKRLQKEFEERLAQEVQSTRDFYAMLRKKENYKTPEEAAKDLSPEAVEAVKAMVNYQGISVKQDDPEQAEAAKQLVENIFTKTSASEHVSAEDKRNRTEEAPYILDRDEYMENETNYTQSSVTWFAGDSVLIDEREDVIDDVDMTVGERNLVRFGYGSGDPNVLYVRNDMLHIEFEILFSEGKYSKEVAGLGD